MSKWMSMTRQFCLFLLSWRTYISAVHAAVAFVFSSTHVHSLACSKARMNPWFLASRTAVRVARANLGSLICVLAEGPRWARG